MTQPRYYGWSILTVLAITETLSYGMLIYAFSVFVVPLELYFGWSRATISAGVTAAQLVAGALAWPVGIWLDRHGARWLMTGAALWTAGWFALWSMVSTPWQHVVVWVMLGIGMAGLLYEPAFVVVANWFARRRSTALTVLTFVAGFAIIIATPVTEWLIRRFDWQVTAQVFAVVMLVVVAPLHAIWLRRVPADVGQYVDGDAHPPQVHVQTIAVADVWAVVCDGAFWLLTVAFLASTAALVVVLQTFIPYLIDQRYTPADAAWYAAAMGVLALPSRLLFTPLGAYVSRYTIAMVLCVMQSLALVALVWLPSAWAVWGCVVLFGLSFGAITPVRAALFAERYGVAAYGAISGVLALILTVARAVVPLAVELVRHDNGSYETTYVWVGIVTAVCALCIVLVPPKVQ